MTYVVTEACIDVKDKSCIDVCPVDCIHETDADRMVFIDPEECIDCGACVDPCPVEAIYAEDELSSEMLPWMNLNAQYFNDAPGVRQEIDRLKPVTPG